MERNERQMKAIHEMDLEKLLISLCMQKQFDEGFVKCKFCKVVMTKNNMYSLFKESGGISFVCDRPECITASLLYLENKKRTLKNNE